MTDYLSLDGVKKVVSDKETRFNSVINQLTKAVKSVHRIDEITNLLDYKANLKDNSNAEFDRIKFLHEIQYESLNKRYEPITQRSGRMSVFFENKEDVVSRFRAAGIEKYRTTTVEVVQSPGEERKPEIWREISKSWSKKMLEWLDNQEGNLSHDENAIKNLDFKILNDNPSSFTKEVLKSLNEDDDFKVIRYHNGQVDEAVQNIITIDLSEETN
ncbi:hypothetical protein ACFQAV_09570 [Companilactobacillus huachuanensis]|uniref:Uncharacterized protein n=1 Tax=Companilactobacillus huachuanensis TaxID=2559914 RepID=A0ABW1RMK4_9LACO|nr:hypothetical protein [Companilactobacillus huachuanensis]